MAIVAVAALFFDIGLTMVPGWGAETPPADAAAWFAQFSANPWLGVRNLDLLNVTVSVISLPLYLAITGAHRRTNLGVTLIALLLVAVGTTVFAASNAALPMLELSRRFDVASSPEQRLVLQAAGEALLSRGAHGSLGAFPGFFISEVGTLLAAFSMLRGGVFGRVTAWMGVAGSVALIGYSVAMTFVPGAETLMMAIAAPGGLMMMAWNVLVARTLFRLAGADAV